MQKHSMPRTCGRDSAIDGCRDHTSMLQLDSKTAKIQTEPMCKLIRRIHSCQHTHTYFEPCYLALEDECPHFSYAPETEVQYLCPPCESRAQVLGRWLVPRPPGPQVGQNSPASFQSRCTPEADYSMSTPPPPPPYETPPPEYRGTIGSASLTSTGPAPMSQQATTDSRNVGDSQSQGAPNVAAEASRTESRNELDGFEQDRLLQSNSNSMGRRARSSTTNTPAPRRRNRSNSGPTRGQNGNPSRR
jgi:hypothetical protein